MFRVPQTGKITYLAAVEALKIPNALPSLSLSATSSVGRFAPSTFSEEEGNLGGPLPCPFLHSLLLCRMLLLKLRRRMPFLDKQIIGGETNLKLSVCGCLHVLGISLLSEWDVLAFVHRHGVSLTNAEQIARLLGYEDSVVESALDRLEREALIRRSRPSRGVHFYRLIDIAEPGRRHSLDYLIEVSETRNGRLLLRGQLNSNPPESAQKEQSVKAQPMKGTQYA